MTRRMMVIAPLVLILGLMLAGCGNLPGSAADAQDTVCGTLDSVVDAVNQLDGIQAEATVADVQELKAKVDGTIGMVRTANRVLNAETINVLLANYDSLSAAIDGLDDDATIGDVLAELKVAVAGVTEALGEAKSALNCGQ